MTTAEIKVQDEYAEKTFSRFCHSVCIGCGTDVINGRLKGCPVIRLDVWLQMKETETPKVLAETLQDNVNAFIDEGLGVRIGRKALGRSNN